MFLISLLVLSTVAVLTTMLTPDATKPTQVKQAPEPAQGASTAKVNLGAEPLQQQPVGPAVPPGPLTQSDDGLEQLEPPNASQIPKESLPYLRCVKSNVSEVVHATTFEAARAILETCDESGMVELKGNACHHGLKSAGELAIWFGVPSAISDEAKQWFGHQYGSVVFHFDISNNDALNTLRTEYVVEVQKNFASECSVAIVTHPNSEHNETMQHLFETNAMNVSYEEPTKMNKKGFPVHLHAEIVVMSSDSPQTQSD
jgi:hypothetical protein